MIITDKIRGWKERLKDKSATDGCSSLMAFILITAIYLAVIIASVTLYLVGRSALSGIVASPEVASGISSPADMAGFLPAALEKLLGISYLMASCVWLVYFGAHNPFGWKKGVSIAFIVAGIIVALAVDALFVWDFYIDKIAISEDIVSGAYLIASAGGGSLNFLLYVVPYIFIIAQIILILFFILFMRGLGSRYFIVFSLVGLFFAPVSAVLLIALLIIAYGIYYLYCIITGLWKNRGEVKDIANNILGSDEFVAGVRRGITGESLKEAGYEEYECRNSAGCSETLYSKDGKRFYNSDGSYAGTSSDGGKTIKK